MTDPSAQDDDWGDLARELGVQKTPAPPVRNEPEEAREPAPLEAPEDDPELEPVGEERPARGGSYAEAASDEQATDEGDEDEGDEADGEGEAAGEATPEEGQPGTGRKRRRRRRRRKKGGAADAPAGGPPAEGDEADVAAPSYRAVARPADDEPAEADAGEPVAEGDEEDAGTAPLAAEEDTGGEVLRELIATWNVPSWDDIVVGLYRPER